MAKFQDERGLSDLYQICEKYIFILFSHWDLGRGLSIRILPGNKSPHMVQMKRLQWRKSFQRCGQGKGSNSQVRKLFSLLELKRQREEIELSQPWELVPRRRSCPAWTLIMKLITTARKRGRAGKNSLTGLFSQEKGESWKKFPDRPILRSFRLRRGYPPLAKWNLNAAPREPRWCSTQVPGSWGTKLLREGRTALGDKEDKQFLRCVCCCSN